MFQTGEVVKFTYNGRGRTVVVENNPKRPELLTGRENGQIKSFHPSKMLGLVKIPAIVACLLLMLASVANATTTREFLTADNPGAHLVSLNNVKTITNNGVTAFVPVTGYDAFYGRETGGTGDILFHYQLHEPFGYLEGRYRFDAVALSSIGSDAYVQVEISPNQVDWYNIPTCTYVMPNPRFFLYTHDIYIRARLHTDGNALQAQFLRSNGISEVWLATPEPSTYGLMLIGAFALLLYRRTVNS